MTRLHIFFPELIVVILFMILRIPEAPGQCPSPENTQIVLSDPKTFTDNQGEIVFTFTDGETPDHYDYRIRLYDQKSSRFLYDDHHLPDQNVLPQPNIGTASLTFTNLPSGQYILLLKGGACNQQEFRVSNDHKSIER